MDVTCIFDYPYEWENIGSVYTCTVKDFIVRIPNENVTNILGTHQDGKTNADVKKLNINKQICEFLPFGFEKFFPNLDGLRVAQSGLAALSQHDISVHPKLRNCDMFNNVLTSLDSELFAKNPALEYLYFGDNQLRKIGYGIFKPIAKLSKAVFQGNYCITKNANYQNEVAALQAAINEKCSSTDYRVTEAEKKIAQLLKEKEKEDKRIEQLESEEKNWKENEDSSSSFFLWIFAIIIGLLATGSAIFYFLKNKPIYLFRNKDVDTDSVVGIIPYNDMNQSEATAPFENGMTNLAFNIRQENC